MGVMMYSSLNDVLHARNLTVDDLRCRTAARFDLAVDMRTLDRRTRGERVRWPDVEIAAAALDVELDDIFLVDAIPVGDEVGIGTDRSDGEEDDVLVPEQSRRFSDLFDLRGRRPLTDDERAKLDALMGAWG